MKQFLLGLSFLFAVNGFAQTEKDSINQPFPLGEVVIVQPNDQDAVTGSQLQDFVKLDVSKAMSLVPGVSISGVGPRNEATVQVRGFDLRQIPVLIDGVPVYVPYDGYVDLARFTTFDLSAIQVSKGYTSVHYGPNALGGAINLITRKPTKRFELNGATGVMSGGFRSNLNVGSKWEKFYVQAGISKFKRDYFPLPDDFTPNANEDGDKRGNSYSNDEKVNLKVAFTPNQNSEYALVYSYQHGEKGSPVYAGNDERNTLFARPRFWQWPKWDKHSLYFLSNTFIDSMQSIKTRFFYDAFKNELESYDDADYAAMTRPYAFRSIYDDYTFGGIVQYDRSFGTRDKISASVQYKQDVHREHNVGEPERTMSDGTFAIGIENNLKLTQKLSFLTGVSFNNRSSITAEDYDGDANVVSDYPSNSNNAVNVQGALVYEVDSRNQFRFSVARKTRFATTKDRYSYRLGTALPNPDLEAEYALNYDLSYKGTLWDKLNFQAAGFYSSIRNTILMVDNVRYDPIQDINLSQLRNVGESEYIGLELGADYKFFDALTLGANYSAIKRNNLSDPSIRLIDVPTSKFFGFAQFEYKDKLMLQANGEYNSSRFSTSYGTRVNPFAIYSASARVKVWKWFSVEGGVNNIFDKNYVYVEGYPEPGRIYFTNLVYRY